MMDGVTVLYQEIRTGLEMRPGPEDATFAEVWELFTDLTHHAGCRVMESRMWGSLEGAGEVQLHLARFGSVAAIAQAMPLMVPAPAVRTLKALGRLVEDTPYREDLAKFLMLQAPIINDWAGYAQTVSGRHARPILAALTVLARSGTLMSDQLVRIVPGFTEEG